jgi:AraC-like DNA-binding protein
MPRNSTLVKLCRAKDYIRDSLAEPIALADVSEEIGFSSWHFLRLFRRTFGETPHEFLTRLRIEKAKDLLTITSRSVTEICFEVGFSSPGSFSSLFSKYVGMSPAAFRRQVRSWAAVPGVVPWVFIPSCFAFMFGGAAELVLEAPE